MHFIDHEVSQFHSDDFLKASSKSDRPFYEKVRVKFRLDYKVLSINYVFEFVSAAICVTNSRDFFHTFVVCSILMLFVTVLHFCSSCKFFVCYQVFLPRAEIFKTFNLISIKIES